MRYEALTSLSHLSSAPSAIPPTVSSSSQAEELPPAYHDIKIHKPHRRENRSSVLRKAHCGEKPALTEDAGVEWVVRQVKRREGCQQTVRRLLTSLDLAHTSTASRSFMAAASEWAERWRGKEAQAYGLGCCV